MCVDNNGVIHIVWSHRITGNFWKIMYSKSTDYGETWSEDYDISQNDDLWMSQPHITFDSENNLYVTYDYNTYSPPNMLVYLQKSNGLEWSEPILVSEGMLGSDYNKVIVDELDRVFVFWFCGGNFYRIYDNGLWSDIMEPYFNSLPDLYYLTCPAIDTNNMIHWIGATTAYTPPGEYAHAYFLYNISSNEWSEPLKLTQNYALVGNDICLNNSCNPYIAIREKTSNTQTYDATYFIHYNGEQWSDAELIVEDPKDQQITIDQFSRPHIIDREKIITGQQLVHYRKINDEWVGYIIDSSGNMVNDAKLLYHNGYLYLTYFKSEVPGDLNSDVLFTKYDVITSIPDNLGLITNLNIFPNPASERVAFEFTLLSSSIVQVMIFDMQGRIIKKINTGRLNKGKQHLEWNIEKPNVYDGVYLCRLYANKYVITKSFEIIK